MDPATATTTSAGTKIMSDTVRIVVRLAVTVNVPKAWAGALLNHVPGGGIEPEANRRSRSGPAG